MVSYPVTGELRVDIPYGGGGDGNADLPWDSIVGTNSAGDTAALNAAIAAAYAGKRWLHATGTFLLTGPIDLTEKHGFTLSGSGMQGTVFIAAAGFLPALPMFDLSGSLHVTMKNFRIGYYNQGAVSAPGSAIQLAQNTGNASNANHFEGLYVSGSYGVATVVNYGVPSSAARDCQFYNYYAAASKHPVIRWENGNAMGLSSTFTTLATGARSCGDWTWTACEFHRFGGGTGAGYEVVSLDGVDAMNFFGGNITGGAVSYVGLYGTNRNINLIGTTMETESEPTTPVYNVYRYPGSSTQGLVLQNCYYVNSFGTNNGGVFGGPGTHS